MKKFNIYNHELLQPEIVKDGWSWPAFFFSGIWSLVKKLWAVSIILYAVWLGAWFIFITVYGYSFISRAENSVTGLDIISAGFTVLFGAYGNSWRVNKLSKLGYKYIETISAKSHSLALAQYKASLGEKKPLSPEKTKAPGTESETKKSTESIDITTEKSQSINEDSWSYIQAKSEIDSGRLDSNIWSKAKKFSLKKGHKAAESFYIEKRMQILIKEREEALVEEQKNNYSKDGITFKSKKDLEEYNKLIYPEPETESEPEIEAESEPEIEEKPLTKSENSISDSNNQSEYINKLKEAKALLDDELINQDDYEKIKQNIIDNM